MINGFFSSSLRFYGKRLLEHARDPIVSLYGATEVVGASPTKGIQKIRSSIKTI